MRIEELRRRRAEILRLAALHGASNVRVFGSVARGEADERSDVDFLVDMGSGRSLLDLGGLLEGLRELLSHPWPCLGKERNRDVVRPESRIWVEAIAPEAGNGPDAVKFSDEDSEDEGGLVPEENITLRLTSAIGTKHRKLLEYRRKGIVARGEPYVIAIGTGDIPGILSETNVSPRELEAMKALAADLLKLSSADLDSQVDSEALQEICHDDQD